MNVWACVLGCCLAWTCGHQHGLDPSIQHKYLLDSIVRTSEQYMRCALGRRLAWTCGHQHGLAASLGAVHSGESGRKARHSSFSQICKYLLGHSSWFHTPAQTWTFTWCLGRGLTGWLALVLYGRNIACTIAAEELFCPTTSWKLSWRCSWAHSKRFCLFASRISWE